MSAIVEIIEARLPGLPAQCPTYWSILQEACSATPPPYGEHWYGELFRRHATDLQWLVRIIALNAKKEADGARQLWQFAQRIKNDSIRSQVRDHAIDEGRHSAFYIAMLPLMFPDDIAEADLHALRKVVPRFDRDEDRIDEDNLASRHAMLDEIVQMNIGEIRTLVNQMLMRPLVDVLTPDENRERALKLIDGLGDDEVTHIGYTARIIEQLDEAEATRHFMHVRLDDFNRITMAELGEDQQARHAFS